MKFLFILFFIIILLKTADIAIPKAITQKYTLNYTTMKDLELSDGLLRAYKEELGSSINPSEARNTWTYYNSEICGYVRLDGNVSPLAKSNFGRNMPEFLATSLNLVTKKHNYFNENKKKLKNGLRILMNIQSIAKCQKWKYIGR